MSVSFTETGDSRRPTTAVTTAAAAVTAAVKQTARAPVCRLFRRGG